MLLIVRFRVDIIRGVFTGRPLKSAILRQTFGKYDEKIHQYYKSATQSKTGEVGDESTADNRANILKSYSLWGYGLIIILGLCFGFTKVWAFFHPASMPDKTDPPLTSKAPEPPPTPTLNAKHNQPATPEPPVKPQNQLERIIKSTNAPSSLWRVSGVIEDKKQRIVILTSVHNDIRRLPFKNYCKLIDGDQSISCLVDNEIITPWTGHTQVSQILEPTSVLTP